MSQMSFQSFRPQSSLFTPKDILETFPQAKSTIKRLIKENEKFLEEAQEYQNEVRGFLASRVPIYDIGICTTLVVTVTYGGKIKEAEENLSRLRRLLYLYEPPKPTKDGITDADIARAKEVPIRNLVEVRMNKTKCLWHSEKTPSMHVYPDQHTYCFSCGKRSDTIGVYQILHNCNFVTAVKALCK